jgi:hypothetical protein
LIEYNDRNFVKKDKKPRNRTELTYQLLKKPLDKLSESELIDVITYVLETPDQYLKNNQQLRTRITKVFSENQEIVPNHLKESLRDFLVKLVMLDARVNFYTFVKLCAEVVIPNKFRDGRHIQVICEHLQELYESYEDPERLTDRLQVFLPPRSMKSVLCSILFPAWVLGRNPKYRILLVGNSLQTAIDVFGRPLKNFISSEEYREIFPDTVIDSQASAAQRFLTTQGGGYFCAGAGTNIAGRGGDFVICDDMLSEQTAFSKVERTKINNNYIPGIRSRCQPGAAELIINTRWHLEDPSGFLLKVDAGSRRPWKVISIPAILDEAAVEALSKPTDQKGLFKEGGSYWPEYKDLTELLELKDNYLKTEPWKWYALYMQNPVPEEGNIVKREDFNLWKKEKPPKLSQIIVSMDTAFSDKERADYSAYTIWGVFYKTVETLNMGEQGIPQIIMINAERGKWDFSTLCEKCEMIRDKYKPDYFVLEKKASGIVLAQELHRRSFPLIEYDPRGKKEERLQAAAVRMRTGQVFVPIDYELFSEYGEVAIQKWAEEVVEEVCNFPSATHDDYTDTVSMALIYLRDLGILRDESYEYEEDEDDFDARQQQKPRTYWASLNDALY